MSRTPTHQCWSDLKQRCYNTNCKKYPIYGGRGIKVCDRWLESFSNFLEDMGEKPKGFTLDRVDNNGDYSKENCRWATPKEQALNRRTNRLITFNGQTKTITEWAHELGIFHNGLSKRLKTMPLEKALSKDYYGNQYIPEWIKSEILNRYYNKEMSQAKLGQLYGVGQAAISKWVVKEREVRNAK